MLRWNNHRLADISQFYNREIFIRIDRMTEYDITERQVLTTEHSYPMIASLEGESTNRRKL